MQLPFQPAACRTVPVNPLGFNPFTRVNPLNTRPARVRLMSLSWLQPSVQGTHRRSTVCSTPPSARLRRPSTQRPSQHSVRALKDKPRAPLAASEARSISPNFQMCRRRRFGQRHTAAYQGLKRPSSRGNISRPKLRPVNHLHIELGRKLRSYHPPQRLQGAEQKLPVGFSARSIRPPASGHSLRYQKRRVDGGRSEQG